MLVSDQKNRLDSLNPLISVCVTAPAGSGKTELLIQRILVLLSRVNKPEEILAITFTRKAAAEMHQRILAALELADNLEEPAENHQKLTWSLARQAIARNQECGWNLLENPGRLKIQTIDSFSASLTRQMPILSKFGSQPQISTSPEKLYRIAAQGFLSSMETSGILSDHLMLLLAHLDNNLGRVEDLLVSLLQRRDQWLVHIVFSGYEKQVKAGLEATAKAIINSTLERVREELQAFAAELIPLLDYAGTNLKATDSDCMGAKLAGITDLPPASDKLDPAWLAITDLLITGKNSWRKSVNVKNGFPAETQEGDKTLAKDFKTSFTSLLNEVSGNSTLLDALVELRHLPASEYSHSQWSLLEALSILLPVLTAELQTVFQQYGEVDYIQVAIAALQSLGEGKSPSELLMKLDYQLQHILLDEFQDTSSAQFDLLKRLVDGWDDNNQINPQAPKTVFIVGDGMQSIYGFRAANVGLFLEARKNGVNQLQLEDLPLSVNFRSSSEVVNWINQVFTSAFPAKDNISRGAVKYEPSTAFKGAVANSAVSINGFIGNDAADLEAKHIAKVAAEELKNHPGQSIAILVRSRNHLGAIIPALKKSGVEWCANEIDPLAQYSFISDLLILTRALANLQDRVAWAALLRSPFCGLNNNDLHALLSSEYTTVWQTIKSFGDKSSLSHFARQRLLTIRTVLQNAFDDRLRKPFRVVVEGVWLKLGGPGLLSDYEQFQHIDDYLDFLEDFEQRNSLRDLDDFETSVAKLYASAMNDAKVHLMTIHKAKGLEFDTVIIPGLAKLTRSNSKTLLMWREYLSSKHSGLVIAPITATGEAEDATYKHLYFEQGIAAGLENTRLLYVACTRAVERLHLCFCLEDETKTPQKNTLLNSIWGTVQEQVHWHKNIPANTEQLGLDFDRELAPPVFLQRISDSWRPPNWSFPNPLSGFYLENDYNDEDNRPLLVNNQPARIIGTVVHCILEQLVSSGINYWLDLENNFRTNWILSLLQAHGLYSKLLPEYAEETIRHIDNTVNDAKGCWILSRHQTFSRTELALIGVVGDKLSRKVIDRCFIDQHEDLWIVDYKTGQPNSKETQADYIARENASYSSQLQNYKLTIQDYAGLTNYKKIRLGLYYSHYPVFEEIM